MPGNPQFSLALLGRLFTQPLWFGGIGLAILSVVSQAYGLSIGSLATVQLLMMLELPLTLLGSAAFLGGTLMMLEWLSISIMTAGIIGLIAALNPQKVSYTSVPLAVWLISTCVSAALVIGLFAAAKTTAGNRQAVFLGAATGVCFGMAAGLLNGVMMRWDRYGLGGALSSWGLYVALAASIAAMWLYQNAVHGGQLIAAQPGVTLLDPCTAILWGRFVFHEKMRGGIYFLLAVFAFASMVAGSIMLARSPALQREGGSARG